MPVRVVESSAPSQVSEGASSGNMGPPFCSLLSVGQDCDIDHAYLCGTMEALNVPMADAPVFTFWEGEIVDTKNYTFFTGNNCRQEDDVQHWTKFPSFARLLSYVEADGGQSLDLCNSQYIFMRWKEQYFVNVGDDCGLTIAGFYYVCFSCVADQLTDFTTTLRAEQNLTALTDCSPFQKLQLKSTNVGRLGFFIFPAYELQ